MAPTAYSLQQQRVLHAIRNNDGVLVRHGDFYDVVARDGAFIMNVKGQTARSLIARRTFKEGPQLARDDSESPYDATYYLQSFPWDRHQGASP